MDKLQEIHHKYSVYPHRPGRLCSSSASASVLLYEDRSKHICEVRWLQCDVSPPKASLGMLNFYQVSKIECTAKLTVVIARNSSWGKVMFSQACVKNYVHRGCIPAFLWADIPQGRHPSWADTPPGRHLLPQALRYMVNKRKVRILLDCILVLNDFSRFVHT